MIEVSVPGKLFIAGEYAVVNAGYPAILVTVDQFIKVSVSEAENNGTIKSEQYSKLPVSWTRVNGQLVLDSWDNPFNYLLSAIHVIEEYACKAGCKLNLYNLTVTSQLDNDSGRKYGLGSSGAVIVATISALAKFYELTLDELQIFKLAAIAHRRIQKNGSCGDIAASTYGGWISFSTFDAQWLDKVDTDLYTLVNQDWPKLKIERLSPPENLKLLVAWTGKPASTKNLVDKVGNGSKDTEKLYQEFLDASKVCVETMIEGFEKASLSLIQQMIEENRRLLLQLSSFTQVEIETKELTDMCDIAEYHGGSAKSSGAGGGDCGIAILDSSSNYLPILTDWQEKGITPLGLNVYFKEGKEDESKR